MTTTIYLVRHGQSEANKLEIFTGQSQFALSELGLTQAQLVVDYFDDIKIDKIYSSDSVRAVQTITPLANKINLPIIQNKLLREIYAGDYEGMKFEDIYNKYPQQFSVWINDIGNAVCVNGESVLQVLDRFYACVTNLAKENLGKTIVITTHATPIRSFICYATYGCLDNMKQYKFVGNASVTKVTFENDKFTINDVGNSQHLKQFTSYLPNKI